MRVCTFFGHRDCPGSIREKLSQVIWELIVNENVRLFYLGNQGYFDQMVLGVLRELKKQFDCPHFDYAVVLAYLPGKAHTEPVYLPEETLYPEGIEKIHPRYALSWRNEWMLRQADTVMAFVEHDWGGAAKFVARARYLGKRVVEIQLG